MFLFLFRCGEWISKSAQILEEHWILIETGWGLITPEVLNWFQFVYEYVYVYDDEIKYNLPLILCMLFSDSNSEHQSPLPIHTKTGLCLGRLLYCCQKTLESRFPLQTVDLVQVCFLPSSDLVSLVFRRYQQTLETGKPNRILQNRNFVTTGLGY